MDKKPSSIKIRAITYLFGVLFCVLIVTQQKINAVEMAPVPLDDDSIYSAIDL